MDKLIQHLQDTLPPLAGHITGNKYLTALRQSFAGIMPIIVPGAIALFLNTCITKMDLMEKLTAVVFVNDLVFMASVPICSLLLAYSLGANMGKLENSDATTSGLVAVASFVMTMLPDFRTNHFSWQGLSLEHLNPSAYLTAIVFASIASTLFCKLKQKDWTFKLPDNVPPTISKTMTSTIPSLVALYLTAILALVCRSMTGSTVVEWFHHYLQTPLLALSQNIIMIAIIASFIQVFWFFGIHGGNVFAPIMEGLFGLAMLTNMEAAFMGQKIPYLWTNNTYGAFVWPASLGLVIAIYLTSKDSHQRNIAQISLTPMIFNIGESLMYGLPVVMNPLYFLPMILCPAILSMTTYLATILGWVAPITQHVTWITPPILYGFLGTGFDMPSLLLSLVNLGIATLLYIPFVKRSQQN